MNQKNETNKINYKKQFAIIKKIKDNNKKINKKMKLKIQFEQTVSIEKIMNDCFHVKIISETNSPNDLTINYSFFCSYQDSKDLTEKFQSGNYNIKELYQEAKSKYSNMGSMGLPCILKKDYKTSLKSLKIDKKTRRYFNEDIIIKEIYYYYDKDIREKEFHLLEDEALGYVNCNMFVYDDKHEIVYMPAAIYFNKEILKDENRYEFLSYLTKEYETTFSLLNSAILEDPNSCYNFCLESEKETYHDYLTKNLSYAWIHPIHASPKEYKEAYQIFKDLNILHVINDATLDGIKYEYALFGKVLLSIMNPSLTNFLFSSSMELYHKSLVAQGTFNTYRLWEEEEKILKSYLQALLLEKRLPTKTELSKKIKI